MQCAPGSRDHRAGRHRSPAIYILTFIVRLIMQNVSVLAQSIPNARYDISRAVLPVFTIKVTSTEKIYCFKRDVYICDTLPYENVHRIH